jgi:hypothetical protein
MRLTVAILRATGQGTKVRESGEPSSKSTIWPGHSRPGCEVLRASRLQNKPHPARPQAPVGGGWWGFNNRLYRPLTLYTDSHGLKVTTIDQRGSAGEG